MSTKTFFQEIKRNINARINAKPYNIWKKRIDKDNDSYWLADGVIWYGQRWFVFLFSHQNSWFNREEAKKYFGENN